MRVRHGEKGAVTLIEVLAIIAAALVIVAILLLLKPPRYVHGQSPTVNCRGSLNMIGKAIYMYAEANGEFYPYSVGRSASDSLALLYNDYVNSARVFKCANTQDAPKLSIIKGPDGKVIDRRLGGRPNWSSFGYAPEIDIRTATALQPIAADMDGSSVAMPGSPTANHQGGQNVLFYDTHVIWKSSNTWNNGGITDNMFTAEFGGGDTDTFIRR